MDQSVAEAVNGVSKQCWRTGLAIELQAAFGLRKKEALMLKPAVADKVDSLFLNASGFGTKGGRPRSIPVRHAFQRELLDRAKGLMESELDCVGGRDLKAAFNRYNYLVKECGLSDKQLRQAYVDHWYETEKGKSL